jgi:cardiolipin synthase
MTLQQRPPEGDTDERARRLRRTLEGLVGVPFTEGNRIEVLRNGVQIFPPMLEAVRGAECSIDLMTFVYWKGKPAREFADALCERAKAGVRVRLLVDAVGGLQIEDGLLDVMSKSGVDVHWFRRPWLNSPFKQNHRGHRKVCVVDESVAFTGGVGIAEEWDGNARHAGEWRDTHFRVEGPAVDALSAAFIQNWGESGRPLYDERDRFPEQPRGGTAAIQVVRGSANIGWDDLHTLWYVMIRSAQHRIRLQSAYFAPDQALRDALKDAVSRGVEVDVLIPGPHIDKRVALLGSEGLYAELVAGGVRVWNFQPSMLHTKVMTVDGVAALVGSSNINRRSLDHDEEVALVVQEPDTVATLEQHFLEDLERSRQIDLERWRHRSAGQRALEAGVRPFRRWL